MRKFTLLFFFIMFMIGTDTFLISPLLPTLQEKFGVATGIAGWMLGAYTLGSAVFALIAGPLSDGWNRKRVLLYGLLGFSAATVLCGLANSFWTMCLFRLLAGISAAFTAPQVWAAIPAVMTPARIAKTMGVAFSGLAAAQAFGVPIGSWLATAGWPVPFWTIGGLSLLLAGLVFRLLPDIKPAEGAPGSERVAFWRRYIPLVTSGKARGGFLAYLLLHLGNGTVFAFTGKWLTDRFELPLGQLGIVMVFLGMGTLLGSMVSAWFVRKAGGAASVIGGLALVAALYAILPHMGNLVVVTSMYLLAFTVLGIAFPIVMTALTSLNSAIRGTISSLANSTMNTANTIGAWAAGLLYVQFGGYSSIGAFSAVCLALSLGTFLLSGIWPRKSRKLT